VVDRAGDRENPVAQEADGEILDCTGLSLAELRESRHPVLRAVIDRLSARILSPEEVLAGFNSSIE
jgi:FXSXX-COOH protein